MIPLIIFLVVVSVIAIVVIKKKKKVVVPPSPTPIAQPVLYSFEVGISENQFDNFSGLSKITVNGYNFYFCSNSEFINFDGAFSTFNMSSQVYLFYDNLRVEVRRSGENAVDKVSNCIQSI